jgi:hypothetical protein
MARHGGGCDAGFGGQGRCRQRPPVGECDQHRGTGRLTHQGSHRGDVGISEHTITLSRERFGVGRSFAR